MPLACHDPAGLRQLAADPSPEERPMPGTVPPVADERAGLLAFLEQQRLVLRLSAYGLTDDQARATPTVSRLTVGGLLKHAAAVERRWMETVLQRERAGGPEEY